MKRKFLKDLGLSNELIDQIMDEHGHTVEAIKENITDKKDKEIEKLTNEKEKEITKMTNDLDKATQKIDELSKNTSSDEMQKQIKLIEEKHEKTMSEVLAETEKLKKQLELKDTEIVEKSNGLKRTALRTALIGEGLTKQLVDLVENKFDLGKLEVDGDGIKDWDNISKPIKESYPDVFKVVTEAGFLPNTPPQSQNNQAVYTIDQIKAMTPSEINANWDKGVKQALENK